MALRAAINGFGRIGRASFRIAYATKDIEIVAINDLTDVESLATLLKYDSIYGRCDFKVDYEEDHLIVDGKKIPVISEKDPSKLPWGDQKIDVVLECTGRFNKDDSSMAHIKAGAKRVVISSPTKQGKTKTYLFGVNETEYGEEHLASNASCTTNCVGPVTAVMEKEFGILKAAVTSIHSYTAEQNIVDGPPPPLHKDLRRARAAAINIVPTTTGAAVATTKVLPSLEGKFDGLALRVPTAAGSLSDFTFLVKRKTTVEEVNQAFRSAVAEKYYEKVLAVNEDPIVLTDIIGDSHSAIVDLPLTKVIDGDLVKIMAWYDNEWGYANRLVELAVLVGKTI